jgi:hypothetical protein
LAQYKHKISPDVSSYEDTEGVPPEIVAVCPPLPHSSPSPHLILFLIVLGMERNEKSSR